MRSTVRGDGQAHERAEDFLAEVFELGLEWSDVVEPDSDLEPCITLPHFFERDSVGRDPTAAFCVATFRTVQSD